MGKEHLDILRIIWDAGIVVKFVLFILLLGSVLSWAVILKKRKMIKKLRENNRIFLEIYYQAENLKEVMLKSQTVGFSPFHTMFVYGYNELSKIKDDFEASRQKATLRQHFKDFGLGMIERSLKKGVNDANLKMDYLLSLVASIGSVSPFVGLFGTVWGIINSFTGLAGANATLDAVAPGIAEALVATAVGLAAAIPAVWFYNYFANENSKLNVEMETFGQEFLNLVERSLVVKGGE